ncbi:hypothetical protein A2U01_0083306, partial [Trifolium medium]|nr:hypothetical protein [Trifolium medium]
RAALRAAPASAARRANPSKKNWPLHRGTTRRANIQNQTALYSKNGATRQMLLCAAPQTENGEIVAV